MRPIPASWLGVLRSVAVVVFGGGFLTALVLAILPAMQNEQLATIEDQFISEQRVELSRTVENLAGQLAEQDGVLETLGLSIEQRDAFLLRGLRNHRFGVAGYGYVFVYEDRGRMLLNPVFPELEGRQLSTILNPEGLNIGTLFRATLADRAEAWTQYLWNNPGTKRVETKSSYLRRVPSKGWVIGAGYFRSDFRGIQSAFLEVSERVMAAARFQTMLAALLAIVAAFSLELFLFRTVRRMEQSLARQLARLEQYKVILDKSSLVTRTDPDGKLTYVNDTFCRVSGWTRQQALGSTHAIERHPDTALEVYRDLWATITRGEVWQGTLKNKKADGTAYLKHATIVPIVDENGTIVEYLSSGHDITEVVDNRQRLETAFMTDALTGLGSRARLLQELPSAAHPCVALADINGFSELNRLFGPAAGDQVLQALAEFLLESSSAWPAHVYRVHSDTFALVCDGPSLEEFEFWVRTLSHALDRFVVPLGDQSLSLLVRFGIARSERDVLVRADEALRKARSRRSTLVVHQAGVGADVEFDARLRSLESVRWALANGRVQPVYQPIVDLKGGQGVKYECLMRLEDAEGRVMYPSEFIDLAKTTGLYLSLSQALFRSVFEAVRHHSFEFSVNLTMEDIQSDATMEFLHEEILRTGVGQRLILELVETEELDRFDRAGLVFERFRAAGVRLAVDDFGSGYASFDYLLRLNPSFVKIDGSIVQKLATDPRARELVSSLVSFAHNAGIKTVAEFLDSEELLTIVQRLDVDYGQGWLLGRAGPLTL